MQTQPIRNSVFEYPEETIARFNSNLDELSRRCLRLIKPRPYKSAWEFNEENRTIMKGESSMPGKVNFDWTPMVRVILDWLLDPVVERITIIGPSQYVKTEILKSIMFYYMLYDPSPILYYAPTEAKAMQFSNQKLQKMIEANKCLQDVLKNANHKNKSSTLYKEFEGGFLQLLGGNSPNSYDQMSARVVLIDDHSRFTETAGMSGDPYEKAWERTESYAFHNRKMIDATTPLIKGKCRGTDNYLASHQAKWEVPCPHCGKYQVLEFGDERTSHGIKWDKDTDVFGKVIKHYPETAKYLCKHCHVLIDEKYKYDMVLKGREIAKHPERKTHKGIQFGRLLSNFSSWVDAVRKYLAVKDSPTGLQTFYNDVMGEVFEYQEAKELDIDFFMKRLEKYCSAEDPLVPNGVLILLLLADVQGDRIECEIQGWGVEKESWSIAYERFYGNPYQDDCWNAMFEYIENTEFTRKDGVKLKIIRFAVDIGYAQTRIETVMEDKFPKGLMFKGDSNKPDKPFIPNTPSTTKEKRNFFYSLGVDQGKTQLQHNLMITVPLDENNTPLAEVNPNYYHFSKGVNDYNYFKGLTAEKAIPKFSHRGPKISWEKKKEGDPNEPWDLKNYGQALIELLNPDFQYIKKLKDEEAEQIKQRKEDPETMQQAAVPNQPRQYNPNPMQMPGAFGRKSWNTW